MRSIESRYSFVIYLCMLLNLETERTKPGIIHTPSLSYLLWVMLVFGICQQSVAECL